MTNEEAWRVANEGAPAYDRQKSKNATCKLVIDRLVDLYGNNVRLFDLTSPAGQKAYRAFRRRNKTDLVVAAAIPRGE